MSETKNTSTEKTVKKSWFNRIWSAMSGLIVGVAAMFGVSQNQIAEIKSDVKEAYDKVQQVQTAIENKDISGAISAVTDAAKSLKEVVGDVKDSVDTAKTSFDEYKSTVEEIKAAMDAKDWTAAHNKAVDFAAKLTAAFPGDQLTGVPKTAYDLTSTFITNLDEGKYDAAIDIVKNIISLFNKSDATATVEAAVEVPATTEEVKAE